MRTITSIFILLIGLLAVSFAVINATLVHVHYFLGTMTLPLSVLIMIVFISGMLFGLALVLITLLRLRLQKRQLAAQVKSLQAEVVKANAAKS